MKRLVLLSTLLACAACSDPIPEIGPGPFRGALMEPLFVEPLPVSPQDLTEDVEVATAPPRVETNEAEDAPVLEERPAEIVATDPTPELTTEETPEFEESTTESFDESDATAEEETDASDADDDEVQLLNFDDLADFEYTPPTLEEIENGTERPEQVPASVIAFDGKVVEIEGYMIPIEVEQGKVQSFILSRTLSGCCFGDMPNIQEWVDVKMEEGESADYIPYAPVLVIGRISVGEQVDEYGITSLYRMTAESVEDPW